MWRKTRSFHPNAGHNKKDCIGVDANRNFNYHWKGNIIQLCTSVEVNIRFYGPDLGLFQPYQLCQI